MIEYMHTQAYHMLSNIFLLHNRLCVRACKECANAMVCLVRVRYVCAGDDCQPCVRSVKHWAIYMTELHRLRWVYDAQYLLNDLLIDDYFNRSSNEMVKCLNCVEEIRNWRNLSNLIWYFWKNHPIIAKEMMSEYTECSIV